MTALLWELTFDRSDSLNLRTMSHVYAETLQKPSLLEFKIENRLETLSTNSEVAEYLKQVHTVTIANYLEMNPRNSIDWKAISNRYFPEKRSGIYHLQIEAISVAEPSSSEKTARNIHRLGPKSELTILILNFFQLKNNNKVYEFSFTISQ